MVDVKPKFPDESADKSKIWKLTEISESSQCRSLRLPDSISAMRVGSGLDKFSFKPLFVLFRLDTWMSIVFFSIVLFLLP